MPYIPKKERPEIDELLNPLIALLRKRKSEKESKGERFGGTLNYVATRILKGVESYNYASMEEGSGALLMAILEFNRKKVAPYEDQKEKENGPVL